MAYTELATPDLLRQLLRYEPETGKLFWKERTADIFHCTVQTREWSCRRWNSQHAGKAAFTADSGVGYRAGHIFGKRYYAHRVAWAITHRTWPEGEIDHIDGNRSNNALSNLRAVSPADNRKNQKRRTDNVSGATGVYWSAKELKWRAQIKVGRIMRSLGCFGQLSDAIAARKAAEVLHGFHPNHGRAV